MLPKQTKLLKNIAEVNCELILGREFSGANSLICFVNKRDWL